MSKSSISSHLKSKDAFCIVKLSFASTSSHLRSEDALCIVAELSAVIEFSAKLRCIGGGTVPARLCSGSTIELSGVPSVTSHNVLFGEALSSRDPEVFVKTLRESVFLT